MFPQMNFRSTVAPAVLAAAFLLPIAAKAQVVPAPENVVQLNTAATVEVPQDVLVFSLTATREGADPGQVQNQLKAVVDAALNEARKAAAPNGAMDVRTGMFNVGPRYNREGKINGWVGTAEIVLEGKDFGRISQTAGKLPGMTVAGTSFRLSKETREQAEKQAQAQAITGFRAKAAELSKAFGFNTFTLREVSVQAQDQGYVPRPRMMAMEAKAADSSPVPVEAGKASVIVNVSGSVQLR
jgi:predicted secreted protein